MNSGSAGVHSDGPVFGAGVCNQVAPPDRGLLPVDIAAGAFQDHHVLTFFTFGFFSASSTFFFSGTGATGAQPFVSGDHQA